MICSARELGLAGARARASSCSIRRRRVGVPLEQVLVAGDRVLDVAITPNRGDCVSLLGMAREVRAHFGGPLRMPETSPEEQGAPASQAVRVSIEAPEACPRYCARVVRGVRVEPSPAWLVAKLEAAGMRSINVVVDVTNLVLLELGQPLHAFDLATLRGGEIRVRRARPDEKIATLDGATRALDAGDLVIADAERAIAIAGVMGGAETEVSERSADVLLESAHFDATSVRRTARRLGISSEASYRFERDVDRGGVAARRRSRGPPAGGARGRPRRSGRGRGARHGSAGRGDDRARARAREPAARHDARPRDDAPTARVARDRRRGCGERSAPLSHPDASQRPAASRRSGRGDRAHPRLRPHRPGHAARRAAARDDAAGSRACRARARRARRRGPHRVHDAALRERRRARSARPRCGRSAPPRRAPAESADRRGVAPAHDAACRHCSASRTRTSRGSMPRSGSSRSDACSRRARPASCPSRRATPRAS